MKFRLERLAPEAEIGDTLESGSGRLGQDRLRYNDWSAPREWRASTPASLWRTVCIASGLLAAAAVEASYHKAGAARLQQRSVRRGLRLVGGGCKRATGAMQLRRIPSDTTHGWEEGGAETICVDFDDQIIPMKPVLVTAIGWNNGYWHNIYLVPILGAHLADAGSAHRPSWQRRAVRHSRNAGAGTYSAI